MSYPVYGRYQVAEPPRFGSIFHRDQVLQEFKTVLHEVPMNVLDQSDLIEQGINTSVLIPGAQEVDALGSCTANAFHAHLSTLLTPEAFAWYTHSKGYTDVVNIERNAIIFYHEDTMLSGDPSTEFPPVDCGSSGPYVYKLAQQQGLVKSEVTVGDAEGIVTLLQTGTLLVGQPFFNAWENPDANGFIDSAGLRADIASGVAGGHETCWWGVEPSVNSASGRLNPERTIIHARNSWGSSWGDHGDYLFYLSTFIPLLQYTDIRQFSI